MVKGQFIVLDTSNSMVDENTDNFVTHNNSNLTFLTKTSKYKISTFNMSICIAYICYTVCSTQTPEQDI